MNRDKLLLKLGTVQYARVCLADKARIEILDAFDALGVRIKELAEENYRKLQVFNEVIGERALEIRRLSKEKDELEAALDRICEPIRDEEFRLAGEPELRCYWTPNKGEAVNRIHTYLDSQKQEEPEMNERGHTFKMRHDFVGELGKPCCVCGCSQNADCHPSGNIFHNITFKPQLKLCPECNGAMHKHSEEWRIIETEYCNYYRPQSILEQCPTCEGQGVVKGE